MALQLYSLGSIRHSQTQILYDIWSKVTSQISRVYTLCIRNWDDIQHWSDNIQHKCHNYHNSTVSK